MNTIKNYSYAVNVLTAPVRVFAVCVVDGKENKELIAEFARAGQHSFLAQSSHTLIEGDYGMVTGPLNAAMVIGGAEGASAAGAQGEQGEPGKDAFEVWKEQEGRPDATWEEYKADIKGEPGRDGADGERGEPGEVDMDEVRVMVQEAVEEAVGDGVCVVESPRAMSAESLNANYVELDARYVPVGGVESISLLCRKAGAVNGGVWYLGVWEQSEQGGDSWVRMGASVNGVEQGLGVNMVFEFETEGLVLHGRKVRLCFLPSADAGWQVNTMGLAVSAIEEGDDDETVCVGSSGVRMKYVPQLDVVYRKEGVAGRFAPMAHVGDDSHLRERERERWDNAADVAVAAQSAAEAAKADALRALDNATLANNNLAQEKNAALQHLYWHHSGNNSALAALMGNNGEAYFPEAQHVTQAEKQEWNRAAEDAEATKARVDELEGSMDKLGDMADNAAELVELAERSAELLGLAEKVEGLEKAAGSDSHKGKGQNSIAIGESIGSSANYSIALGNLIEARGSNSIAIGTFVSTDGVYAVGIGYQPNSHEYCISIGTFPVARNESIAIGKSARSEGTEAVALGNSAGAKGDITVAIGKEAKANDSYGIAIGNSATSETGIAVGYQSNVTGSSGVGIGRNAQVSKPYGVALGINAEVSGSYGIAMGASTRAQEKSIAIGYNTKADENYSVAVGNTAGAHALRAIALGNAVRATGMDSCAIGQLAEATEHGAIAIGNNAAAGKDGSIALGEYSYAQGAHSIALGEGATAKEDGCIVLSALASEDSAFRGASLQAASGEWLQVYFFAAGSELAKKYTNGEAGMGFISADLASSKDPVIKQRGCVRLSALCTEHTSDFAPDLKTIEPM